jgi:hypothetical protein
MFDDLEDGPRLAMWLVVGLLGLTLLGVAGGVMLREWRAGLERASAQSTSRSAANHAQAAQPGQVRTANSR